MAAKKNWIKKAIKRPGALKAAAKRAGALNKDGTIKVSWLNKKTTNKRLQKQKNLAKTLRKMKKTKTK